MTMDRTLEPGAARVPKAAMRGPLEGLLKAFSEVRPGEAATALLLMLDIFLLLGGYYILKTIREPLILAVEQGGAEYKAYSSAAIAALLFVLVPAYSALASRVSRIRLINAVTFLFIACLLAFFVWAQAVGAGGVTGESEAARAAAT